MNDSGLGSTVPSGLSGSDLGGQFLTFYLNQEIHGLQILKVREIIEAIETTRIPRTPAYLSGIINLRGTTIPVINLRAKLNLPKAENTEPTCIIVVDVGPGIGILVDSVSEVIHIPGNQIEPPPCFGDSRKNSIILGMGKVDDDVKILLNIGAVLTNDEMQLIDNCISAQPTMNTPSGS